MATKSNQVEAELLASAFRKRINDGNVYVITENGGEIVELKRVRYFTNGEYEELNKVAVSNKAKHDLEKQQKLLQEKQELENKLVNFGLADDEVYSKVVRLSKNVLRGLKIIYGTNDEDLELVISEIEKELNTNE